MTISIKSPTSTTSKIQQNGSDVLTVDSSNNVTVTNNLSVSGTVSSTGDINFDSGTLYVDATNNRVGIGTSSPAGALDVVGGRTFLSPNSEIYALGVRYNSTTGSYYIGATNSATPDMVFSQVGGSERMRITNSGWLGIGITSPARMLDVLSGARFQGSQSGGTMLTANGALGGVEVTGGGGANAAFMSFHRPGAYGSYFGLDTDNYFAVGGWSAGAGLHAFKCGALSKTSGSFKIDHPLPELNETHNLVHSFVESPQANNIYRGKVELVNGQATVNLDTVSTMTEGTFVALNRDIHCYTSNETDWDAVKGSVNGNILTIQCQNENSTATVSWLVIGERQDQHMYNTDWTDENGKVIVEPLKTKSAITSQVPMDEEMENPS